MPKRFFNREFREINELLFRLFELIFRLAFKEFAFDLMFPAQTSLETSKVRANLCNPKIIHLK